MAAKVGLAEKVAKAALVALVEMGQGPEESHRLQRSRLSIPGAGSAILNAGPHLQQRKKALHAHFAMLRNHLFQNPSGREHLPGSCRPSQPACFQRLWSGQAWHDFHPP